MFACFAERSCWNEGGITQFSWAQPHLHSTGMQNHRPGRAHAPWLQALGANPATLPLLASDGLTETDALTFRSSPAFAMARRPLPGIRKPLVGALRSRLSRSGQLARILKSMSVKPNSSNSKPWHPPETRGNLQCLSPPRRIQVARHPQAAQHARITSRSSARMAGIAWRPPWP